MVDAERALARLARLDPLLEQLDGVRDGGLDAYLAHGEIRAATERWLQLALQICIDVGAQLAAELSVRAPSSYAEVFANLASEGHLPQPLAGRLVEAAKLRNLLIHLYLDLDDRKVFAALDHLDDLREFARLAQELADSS